MLTCWTQQTQPSPTFIQHSLEQWIQLSYQVLSFENSHWAGLGRILGRCLCNHRKTLMSSVYLCLFPWEGFPWQTCKNHLRRNKDVNIWIKFKLYTVWQFFYACLGRSVCQGNEHHGIDPDRLNSGHHDSSTQWQAVFLCAAVKLQCCHTLVHWTQHTQPSPKLFLANLQKSPSSKPQMLSGKDFVFLRTAESYADYAGICWHMLPFWVQPSPPFTRAMALCHVRGCGAERVACPADTLDKSRHKPGQEGQLPNPRSISLAKCAAQLPSLNLVNKLCLSNSDADVQSVGYNSAQSPTNWQLIHGKDPSILCWLPSRLSIALWWKPERRNPSFCIDTRNL